VELIITTRPRAPPARFVSPEKWGKRLGYNEGRNQIRFKLPPELVRPLIQERSTNDDAGVINQSCKIPIADH